MTKKNIILTFCLLIVFGILILVYGVMRGWFNKKSKASSTPTVSLRLDPVPSQIDENGPFSYTIKAKSNQNLNIIGYLFTIDFDKTKIQVNTIEYKTGVISQDLGQDTNNKDVINQLGKIKIQAEIPSSQGQLITSNTDIDLIVVGGKALTTGIPQLSLSNFKLYQINSDSTLTEVSGGAGESSTSSSSSHYSSTSSGASNQSASSSSAQESVKTVLKIKYRMQGVFSWAVNKSVTTKLTILKNGTEINSATNNFIASLSSDLLWYGKFEQQMLPSNDYVLLIKPDKHLQRKVCSLSARDSTSLYTCGQEKIALSSTTTDIDLSGLTFFTGDITGDKGVSDGKIDSLDYSMINNIIQNNTGQDPSEVAKADLNYDGKVDMQDGKLIIEAWQKGVNQDEK